MPLKAKALELRESIRQANLEQTKAVLNDAASDEERRILIEDQEAESLKTALHKALSNITNFSKQHRDVQSFSYITLNLPVLPYHSRKNQAVQEVKQHLKKLNDIVLLLLKNKPNLDCPDNKETTCRQLIEALPHFIKKTYSEFTKNTHQENRPTTHTFATEYCADNIFRFWPHSTSASTKAPEHKEEPGLIMLSKTTLAPETGNSWANSLI